MAESVQPVTSSLNMISEFNLSSASNSNS
jgi:hypothetical protein